jgi:hypothetical protein
MAANFVLLDVDGHLSLLSAESFAPLIKGVRDAYGHLVHNPASHELGLTFTWRSITLDVRSQETLDTFRTLVCSGDVDSRDGVPVLRVVEAEKITGVPTLDQLEEDLAHGRTPGSSRRPSRPTTPYSRPASAAAHRGGPAADEYEPPAAAVPIASSSSAGAYDAPPRRNKSAAPPRTEAAARLDMDAPASMDSPPKRNYDDGVAARDQEVEYAYTAAAAVNTRNGQSNGSYEHAPPSRDRPNSAVARELLDSFRPSQAPPGPQIRAVMRDGSYSRLIDFDPNAPPTVAKLRQTVWSLFSEQLEDKVTEVRGTPEGRAAEERMGTKITAGAFLLSFWFEGCDLPIDIEDHEDLALLVRAATKFGLDDVMVYVDIPFVEPINLKTDVITETVLPVTPRGLQVNQTRLPSRSAVRSARKRPQAQ